MSSKATIVAGIVAVACVGLALGWSQGRSTTPQAPKRAAATVKPFANSGLSDAKTAVMGFLDTRGNKITLYGNGRFGIADKNGKMLIDNASLDEVKKRSPELAGILDRALAQDARGGHHAGSEPTFRTFQMHDGALR